MFNIIKEMIAIYYNLGGNNIKNFLEGKDNSFDYEIIEKIDIKINSLILLKRIAMEYFAMYYKNIYSDDNNKDEIETKVNTYPKEFFMSLDTKVINEISIVILSDNHPSFLRDNRNLEILYGIFTILTDNQIDDYIEEKIDFDKTDYEIDDEYDEDELMPEYIKNVLTKIVNYISKCVGDFDNSEYKNLLNYLMIIGYSNIKLYSAKYKVDDLLEKIENIEFKSNEDIYIFFNNLLDVYFMDDLRLDAPFIVTDDKSIEFYNSIDKNVYKQIKENVLNYDEKTFEKEFVQIMKFTLDAIVEDYQNINIMQMKNKTNCVVEVYNIEGLSSYLYTLLVSGNLYSQFDELILNDQLKEKISLFAKKYLCAKYIESANYSCDAKKTRLFNKIYNAKEIEYDQIFIEDGQEILENYLGYYCFSTNMEKNIQQKAYYDGLSNKIFEIWPNSRNSYEDILNEDKYLSLTKQLLDISNNLNDSLDQFLNYESIDLKTKKEMILSAILIAYENNLISEKIDEKFINFVEINNPDQILSYVLKKPRFFKKIINMLKKYMYDDYDNSVELEVRKNVKNKGKNKILSKIKSFYNEEK